MDTKTILLVEDSEDDVALTEAAFARLGSSYRLMIAEDGETALEHLLDPARGSPHGGAGTAQQPDLVLLDLKLPGVDGFEVLRRIRSNAGTAMLPVVVLTSSVEERDVLMSYRLGANSYVRKPVDFDEFVSVAEQLTRYWLSLNQAAPSEVRR